MRHQGMSWFVVLADGTRIDEHDATSPLFKVESQEVPMSTIPWPEVRTIGFSSSLLGGDLTHAYDPAALPDGMQMALRRRTFSGPWHGGSCCCYLLMLVDAAANVHTLTDDQVYSVMYVFPDGTMHECPQLNCGDCARYGGALAANQPRSLSMHHGVVKLGLDALLAPEGSLDR